MSAHIIHYYGPQRQAILHYMHEIGGMVTSQSPRGVDHQSQLHGLEDVLFMYIDGHPNEVPEGIWEMLRARGAIIMRVDDHWARRKHVLQAQHVGKSRG